MKVSISDLNIRKGPGTDYDRVQFIPIGVYTIMEVRSGKGSSAGWGRLKSGIGWISLDFVEWYNKHDIQLSCCVCYDMYGA